MRDIAFSFCWNLMTVMGLTQDRGSIVLADSEILGLSHEGMNSEANKICEIARD
jgi:hypothetical protein